VGIGRNSTPAHKVGALWQVTEVYIYTRWFLI
jgi:hypothetical protein